MRLQAVILDWAGTAIDHGSRAPVAAIQSLFNAHEIQVSAAEVRRSMGLAKKSHIREVLRIPRIQGAWIARHGSAPSETDVEALYAEFIPKQLEVLEQHSELIPGVVEAVERMRSRGLSIGSTTGYNRAMLDYLLERAAAQNFRPDSAFCPGDAGAGRPMPWMCYLNAVRLEKFPMASFVKIGDTPSDIEEGLNAGMWTVGVTHTGNEVGLSESEWKALHGDEREGLAREARERLMTAGAHYCIDSVATSDAALNAIEERLARGEKP